MKKIYISGKMTGIENYNYPAFNEAENKLKRLGYDVFNPAKIIGDDSWTWQDYMRVCIKNLPNCTHIYMLDGWETSRGANIELFLANTIGLKVIYESDSVIKAI